MSIKSSPRRSRATGHYSRLRRRVKSLLVDSVIDRVDREASVGLADDEAILVLADHVLLLRGQAINVQDLVDGVVRCVGHYLLRNVRIHPWKLRVQTNVGIIEVNDLSGASETFRQGIGLGIRERRLGGDGCCKKSGTSCKETPTRCRLVRGLGLSDDARRGSRGPSFGGSADVDLHTEERVPALSSDESRRQGSNEGCHGAKKSKRDEG
eukprot:EC123842.1.p1 GENE.EC123842.1~~EC123842.1.p1  ORF type:complete len:210 (-),score=31.42 EC123842.1:35-664(-)